MLTNHCYDNIIDKWDEQDPNNRIRNCCITTNPEDPTCSDCCYDTWQDKLKDVSQSYKQAGEKADQLKKKLIFITDRRDRYRTWVSELSKAEDKARLICHQLEIIITQSDKIWYNACKAVEAIEILYCMIRDFYFQVDYLKERYDDLQACLTLNHDPSLVKGQGILKYLEEYSQKLDIVIKTRDEIIKAVLEAIRISNLIRNNISTKECPPATYNPCDPQDELCPDCNDPDNRFYGFKTIVCEWYNEFKCDEDCLETMEGEETTPEQGEQTLKLGYGKKGTGHTTTTTPTTTTEEEEEKCHLKPIFHFPICNDWYKWKVDGWLKKDEASVSTLSKELKDLSKIKESLQACKDSLVKAIAEVDPKERCK